jgi:oxygen-dependent protoporphyrinogen oxidase
LNGDESLGGFVSRRLGRAAYENLIEPLMSGIYAGDGDQLSLTSTFPYLRDLEHKHGGLVKGALEMKRQSANNGKAAQGSRSAFLTPTTGLAEIVEALVAFLENHGANLLLKRPAARITYHENQFSVQLQDGFSLQADSLIVAAPAFASGALLAAQDPDLAAELQAIPYISTATVSLAYRQSDLPRSLDGYGYVIPRREGRRALACTWTSTKFPHRAPAGFALLRVFVGRAGQEEDIPWEEQGLLDLACEELKLTLGITTQPLLTRVFLWEKAMPQYNLGHPQRLSRIESAVARYPGLALAGNGYRGIGIPDCIRSGELAAEKILAQQKLSANFTN